MFPYKNPITFSQSSITDSVNRNVVYGNTFSILNIGGYMEVWGLNELELTLTSTTYPSQIQLSANTIPINFTKGTGSLFSPDSISLNSDNISSGRRRLGMLVFVQETGKVYQYTIDNYEELWNNMSGLTGNSAVTQSDYSTIVNSYSQAGRDFIDAWTGSTIEGVSGVTRENARWRIFSTEEIQNYGVDRVLTSDGTPTGIEAHTGVTISGDSIFVEGDVKTSYLSFNDSTSYLGVSNDVRNWWLTGDIYYVGLAEASATGIFFKPDGSRFYIVGQTNDRVIAFDMSIAWDIKTAVQAEFYSVSIEGTPTDLFFKEDGTVLYIVGNTTDLVRQFTLPTAWNLTGATASGTFNVVTQDGDPQGIYIREDGLKMYIAGNTAPDRVFEYDLLTAWDITTSVYLQSFSVSAQETVITGLYFNNNGTRMYILGTTGDDITEYRLSTAWDISTAVYFSESFTFVQEGTPNGLYYNEQQNLAFVIGTTADNIIALGTTKEAKIYGESVITDGQLYVGGRMEVRSTIYNYGNITTLGSLIASGSLIGSGTNLGGTDATLLQTNLNLGGATTLTVPYTYTTNINYGRMYSGQTRSINIARNSQYGSNTFVRIGDANYGTMTSTLDASFKRDVNVLGSLSVSNNFSPVLSSSVATGNIEVYDTFTEATNTLLNLHTPNIGSGWTRVQISTFTTPTFTVFSGTNTMGVTTPISNQGVIYTQDTVLTNPNYEVSVDLVTQATSDDTMWLFARYQNFDNFYGVKWSSTIGNCSLYKKVNGVYTTLSTLQIAPILGTTSLTLRVFDNYIVVLNGSDVVMTAYDESIILPGFAAIGAGNILQVTSDDFATWRFDNFKVQSYDNNFTNSYIENGNFGIGTTTPNTKLDVNGDTSITGQLNISPISASSTAATIVSGSGTIGGVEYIDFLKVTNTAAGATNMNTTFRKNLTGDIEMVNSTYTNTVLSINDNGSITTQGNITMPNRPAFRVVGTGGSIAATTTISGSDVTVEFNQGSHYNQTTGKFTAPVAGLYQVNVVCRTATNSNIDINQIIVRKQLSGGGAITTQIMLEWAANTSVNHMGGSSIVSMAVGDTLWVDVTVGTISFDGNDNFSAAYIG